MHTILQVLPELDTGGVEQTTVDIAKALTQNNWRALVVSQGGRLLPELEKCGATHFELPVKSKNPFIMRSNARHLEKIIETEKVDLIHARSRAPAWSALWASRRCGIPFVTTYHGAYNQNSRLKALYNSSMARSDKIIANSIYTADLIADRHPFAKERITVIYRGINCDEFQDCSVDEERLSTLRKNWRMSKDCRIIFNSARLTKWKGQISIIRAFSELVKDFPNLRLVLAGSSQGRQAYLDEVNRFIAESRLSEKVRVVGHCSDIPAAIKLADFAVVGSIEPEAFGRAAVEAQAGGKPCIATNIGAAVETVLTPPEVEESQRTGWLVPPNDSSAMSAAMRKVLSLSEQDRAILSERVRKHVQNNFSLELMEKNTLALYEELLH